MGYVRSKYSKDNFAFKSSNFYSLTKLKKIVYKKSSNEANNVHNFVFLCYHQ